MANLTKKRKLRSVTLGTPVVSSDLHGRDEAETRDQGPGENPSPSQLGEDRDGQGFGDGSRDEQPAPPVPKEKPSHFKVIVLLENASLESVKVGKEGRYELLNSDDHQRILKKFGKDPSNARPDITHQCLLALLDSPLNKCGKLKVYIRTAKNVLIDIHPDTRIPRTLKRFSGLMVELLDKLKIRATNSPHPLLKVIRNPITSHLPVGCKKIVCTYNCDNLVAIGSHSHRIASELSRLSNPDATEGDPTVVDPAVLYVVGAMAHGKIVEDWAEEEISISEFPLSASTVCHRIVSAYEDIFGIV